MGRYDGILILSDIDGTLTARGGEISPGNLDAIERFQAGGGLFSLCTGRPPRFLDRFPFRSNGPVVTINGTLLCAPDGAVLARMPMADDCGEAIRDFPTRFPYLRIITRHEGPVSPSWERGKNEDLAPILRGDPCYKFVFVCDTETHTLEMKRTLVAELGGRYEFDRSWPVGLEMHALGTGKGACVRRIRTLYPGLRCVIAAGDYENDVSMLREADVGCAVAGAIPAVREAADRVIVSSDEDAIRHIVDVVIPELFPD